MHVRKPFLKLVSVFGFVTLLSPVALTGCGVSSGDLCDARCECEGCSAYQYDSCVLNSDADADYAARIGCDDLYNDYVSCSYDLGYCRGADWENPCKVERDRWRNCIGK